MNPQHATNWLPGLLVLAAGLVAALAYLFSAKTSPAEAPPPGAPDDLDARYQAALGQLKEHVANKHLLPAEDWAREKARLELAAAEVLRARDGQRHEAAKAQARAEKLAGAKAQDTGFFGRRPALLGALVGGAAVGFFALVGLQLSQTATERQDGMPATGMMPAGQEPQGAEPEPHDAAKLQALAQRVQAAPDDADAVADLAMLLIRRQAFQDAKPLVDRVTLLDPFQVKGRVGREVMRALNGQIPPAIAALEALAARYPDEAWDASMFAGILALETNDGPRAIGNLERYLASAPQDEQPPTLRMAVAQLRQQLAAGGP